MKKRIALLLAFASMFVISVLAIIIQMLLTVDIRLVLEQRDIREAFL